MTDKIANLENFFFYFSIFKIHNIIIFILSVVHFFHVSNENTVTLCTRRFVFIIEFNFMVEKLLYFSSLSKK